MEDTGSSKENVHLETSDLQNGFLGHKNGDQFGFIQCDDDASSSLDDSSYKNGEQHDPLALEDPTLQPKETLIENVTSLDGDDLLGSTKDPVCKDNLINNNADSISEESTEVLNDNGTVLDTNNLIGNGISSESTSILQSVLEENPAKCPSTLPTIAIEPENGNGNFIDVCDDSESAVSINTIEDVECSESEITLTVPKEESNLIEFQEEPVLGITISNVFTDRDETVSSTVETVEDIFSSNTLQTALFSSINYPSRTVIKSVLKNTRSFTSSTYLWFMVHLAPKCTTSSITMEKKTIQDIIGKLISDKNKTTVEEILEGIKHFTTDEYTALFIKLRRKRTKLMSTQCVTQFNQCIMWVKSHYKVVINSSISKEELCTSYALHCNKFLGSKPLKSTDFINILKNIYPMAKERRMEVEGVKQYLIVNIKTNDELQTPKLPKFTSNQLLTNKLNHSSCHECCSMYSTVILQKTHVVHPNIKTKKTLTKPSPLMKPGPSDTSVTKTLNDPLGLFNITGTANTKTKEKVRDKLKRKIIEVVDLSESDKTCVNKQPVAKKSTFSKRIKRVPQRLRDFETEQTIVPIDYSDKLLAIKSKLSRLVITKLENSSRYKASCICCQDEFYLTEQVAVDLLAAQENLNDIVINPKRLPKSKRRHHPSIKHLYYAYNDIILPEEIVNLNIEPAVSLNRFEVYDWYKNQIDVLKCKLLANDGTTFTSSLKGKPFDQTGEATISPAYPVVTEASLETIKTNEVFIKAEPEFKICNTAENNVKVPVEKTQSFKPDIETKLRKKRSVVEDSDLTEVSTSKRQNLALSTKISRTRHPPYKKQKENDYIYFPIIDTSPTNLRLTNLGTLYQCLLCLMLFNTEQKLSDHEQSHLFCHQCKRKFRDVEIMRQHLVKHCQRNYRKKKPLIKIHRVDGISIMVKKYAERFELCKEYYKPKKKYKEMIRPKVEMLPTTQPIEEVLIPDVKPIINPEALFVEEPNNFVLQLDVKPLHFVALPSAPEIPAEPITDTLLLTSPNVQMSREPPKLIPIAKQKPANTPPPTHIRPFKIRVKDLMELS